MAILAGGFGTRLGHLTDDLPKPMIPIGGRPYLERVIESFARCELRDIVLLTGIKQAVETLRIALTTVLDQALTVAVRKTVGNERPSAVIGVAPRCSAPNAASAARRPDSIA